jgi:hypothetical protein
MEIASKQESVNAPDGTAIDVCVISWCAKESFMQILGGNASFSSKYNHLVIVVLILCPVSYVSNINSFVDILLVFRKSVILVIWPSDESFTWGLVIRV